MLFEMEPFLSNSTLGASFGLFLLFGLDELLPLADYPNSFGGS